MAGIALYAASGLCAVWYPVAGLAVACVLPVFYGVTSAGLRPPSLGDHSCRRYARPSYTPGWDLVGRVVAAGEGVGPPVIGSRVLGFSLWFESLRGTQATLVALLVGNVVPAPVAMPSAQLTTVGLNGLTAWRGLADLKLANGETLVVTGAAGSVGGFAIELAAARGFTVVGVVREGQKRDALDLGATAVVSADDADLGRAVREIRLVLSFPGS